MSIRKIVPALLAVPVIGLASAGAALAATANSSSWSGSDQAVTSMTRGAQQSIVSYLEDQMGLRRGLDFHIRCTGTGVPPASTGRSGFYPSYTLKCRVSQYVTAP